MNIIMKYSRTPSNVGYMVSYEVTEREVILLL